MGLRLRDAIISPLTATGWQKSQNRSVQTIAQNFYQVRAFVRNGVSGGGRENAVAEFCREKLSQDCVANRQSS